MKGAHFCASLVVISKPCYLSTHASLAPTVRLPLCGRMKQVLIIASVEVHGFSEIAI